MYVSTCSKQLRPSINASFLPDPHFICYPFSAIFYWPEIGTSYMQNCQRLDGLQEFRGLRCSSYIRLLQHAMTSGPPTPTPWKGMVLANHAMFLYQTINLQCLQLKDQAADIGKGPLLRLTDQRRQYWPRWARWSNTYKIGAHACFPHPTHVHTHIKWN